MVNWWYERDLKREKLKEECYAKQRGICVYCGKELTFMEATLDRVVPRTMGGTYSMDNTVVAHARCNQNKANRLNRNYWHKLKNCGWLNLERIRPLCHR